MTLLDLKDLETHLWEAAHIITGPIDASDYKTYIFPILFFKRICDVYDEELEEAIKEIGDEELARGPMFHRIDIPEGCHWSDVIAHTQDVGKHLKEAFNKIEQANENLYGIFGDASWTNKERLSDELLITLLGHFNKYHLGVSKVRNDDMGRAYEYLIKRFADKANKKAGEFYTPRSIVRLLVNILDPKAGESIYDPACGTGGMLLETIHHVSENGGDPLSLTLKGQEKNLTTEAIARMNLFLHGQEDFQIVRGDTLLEPKFLQNDQLEQFDCVIANPPFSLKEWGYNKWSSDPYARNVYMVEEPDESSEDPEKTRSVRKTFLAPKTNGDFAWIQHMLASVKDDGRMAVVLPHGVLFRGSSELEIRKQILLSNQLEAVIGVAPNLFYGTTIAACILILRKNRAPMQQKNGTLVNAPVLFINAEDIFTKGRAQNTLSNEQSDEIYDLYIKAKDEYQQKMGKSRWVSFAEIEKNGFNLNIARYIQKLSEQQTMTLEQALTDFKAKMADLAQAEKELESLLEVQNSNIDDMG
ncbi:TPA: SAM-dependent DNA methyltransferase [Acinetobacter baumannii]|nr:SAM-dependent DNA methyltransferase [Acinetobacter baumannii]HCJ1340891.1 SAM-dependent DNA methyltransferase [Acinetobacter baumannii]